MTRIFNSNVFQDAHDIPQLMRHLAGASSMCWENVNGAGVFLSDDAKDLSDLATQRALELLKDNVLSDNILAATEQFMELAGQLQVFGFNPDPSDEVRRLRRKMLLGLDGEVKEYDDAEYNNDPVEVADGLLDIIVVAWGSLLAYFGPEVTRRLAREVARSNLDKVVGEGLPIKNEDGKVLKPEGWIAPRIIGVLTEAGVI